MVQEHEQSLGALLKHLRLGWMIDSFGNPTEGVKNLESMLDAISALSKAREPARPLQLTVQSLLADYQKSPHKVKAFLQALSESNSAEMLLMVWRILQGMQIGAVVLHYNLQKGFDLRVTLKSPYEDPVETLETFSSQNIDDAALMRHFGIMEVDGPVFDGFYPHITS